MTFEVFKDALPANMIATNAGSTTEDFKLAMFFIMKLNQSYFI
jgi:hypothetical protein